MSLTIREKIAGLPAIIYRRKSQEDKSRQILSLSTQADICDELKDDWNADIIENYSETKSALTAGKRELFQEMMKRIEKGEAEVLICWKIDRLARNMREGGWIIDLLQSKKLKAIITKEKVYLPEDNTIITAIEMATATEYSRELSKKVNDGNAKKARKGIPNTHAIIGYLNNTHKLQGERDWRDDPERWHHLQRGLRKILDDDIPPYQVFLWLRDKVKMTTPKRRTLGGKPISQSIIYRFLKRSEIAGFFYYKGEKIKIADCTTPMITEDEYWRIQLKLGSQGHKRTTQSISAYSGYIYSPEGSICTPDSVYQVTCDCKLKFSIKRKTICAACGKDVSEMKKPKFFFRKYYYNTERKRNRVKTKGVNEQMVDDVVIKLAHQLKMSDELTFWSQKFLNEAKDEEIQAGEDITRSRKQRLQKLEDRKLRAKDAYLDGVFTQEEYMNEVTELERMHLEEKAQPQKSNWHITANNLTAIGNEIIETWKKCDIKEKREVLAKLQSNLCWDEEKLSIITPKWVNALVSMLPRVQSEINSIEPLKTLEKQYSLEDIQETFPTLCTMWEAVRTTILNEEDEP
jgi:site-specific DNA recombinase